MIELLDYYGKTYPLNEHLTKKEVDIMELIIKGYTNKEIAEILCNAQRTITTHLSNLYHKFSIHDKTKLSAPTKRIKLVMAYLSWKEKYYKEI